LFCDARLECRERTPTEVTFCGPESAS